MKWAGKLFGIVRARWFPYVLVGWVSSVLIACGWGFSTGYSNAESNYQEEMNKALASQLQRERAQSTLELNLAIRNERAKYETQRRVDQVPRPVVSCDLPAQCVQWYDDILHAAHGDIGGAD